MRTPPFCQNKRSVTKAKMSLNTVEQIEGWSCLLLQSWSKMGPSFADLVPSLADFTFLVKTKHEMRNKSLNWVYFTINFKMFLQSMWSLCLYLTPTICMTEWQQATSWKVGWNRPIGPMSSPLWRAWFLEVAIGSTPIGPVPKHSSGMSIVDSQY
jgi:hypothetical protein